MRDGAVPQVKRDVQIDYGWMHAHDEASISFRCYTILKWKR